MNEFRYTNWLGSIISFNYSGDNRPDSTQFASACLTNGCTYHKKTSRGDAYYELVLDRDYLRLASGGSFWCPFTLEQIIRNLDDINEAVPVTYKIEETEKKFKINLKISNSLHSRKHFYVLTRVRYLYEFPQSALFYDVFRLKDTVKEFNDWSLQNLYNLVVSAIPIKYNGNANHFSGRSYWYDPYHSIPLNVQDSINELLSNEQLRDRDLKFISLNQIYNLIKKSPAKIPYEKNLFNSLAYWRDTEGFELRLPYYRENATLYTDNDKMKAKPVKIDSYSEKMAGILKTEIDLGYSKARAKALISNEYVERKKEIADKVRALAEETEKKEKKPFTRPRDARGRFIKIIKNED